MPLYLYIMNKFFVKLAQIIYPSLEKQPADLKLLTASDVLGFLFSLPLAVGGLIWLSAVTHWAQLNIETLSLLGVSLVLIILLGRVRYFEVAEISRGRYTDISGSLMNVILWAAVWVAGPAALWLGIVGVLAEQVSFIRVIWNRGRLWNWLRNTSMNLAILTLSYLTGFSVYQNLGGSVPLPGLAGPVMGAALAGVLVEAALTMIFWLLYFLLIMSVFGPTNRLNFAFMWFYVTSFGLPALAEPFSILAAVLYVQNGLGAFLFFGAGLYLVSALVNRLSRIAENNRQQTLQLARLEQLGRALLETSPGLAELESVLAQHVPGIFTSSRVEIRLLSGKQLFKEPAYAASLSETAWEWLRDNGKVVTSSDLNGPTLGKIPDNEGGWILAPLLDAESGAVEGGVFVGIRLISQSIGVKDFQTAIPAVQTLAAEIASATHRIIDYERTLVYQAALQELKVAGQIQSAFLPDTLPEIPGWEINALLKPARQTSGDFYDVFTLPDGKVGLVVADVADKGMGAALYMALSRTLIRTYAKEMPNCPAQALAAANQRILDDTHVEQFVTVFYGVLTPQTGSLVYCNAGHNPALRLGETQLRLGRTGMALGVFSDTPWEEKQVNLELGEALMLYTDGITEAQNDQGLFYGLERLAAVAQANLVEGIQSIQKAVLKDLQEFSQRETQEDDVTMVLVKWNQTIPGEREQLD
jgi:serine phosphatase RsbU (regulator of sigma subunit)